MTNRNPIEAPGQTELEFAAPAPAKNLVKGRDLKVGDMMRFLGTWHRIVALVPYEGVNAYLWDFKARIAKWEDGAGGMTIGPDDWIEVA